MAGSMRPLATRDRTPRGDAPALTHPRPRFHVVPQVSTLPNSHTNINTMRTYLLLVALLLAAATVPAAAWWEWRPPFWVENGPNSWCGWFPRPPCPVRMGECVCGRFGAWKRSSFLGEAHFFFPFHTQMCEGPPLPGGGPGCNWYGK